ncbi:MAG: hypothetical protein KAR21_26025 [Spirochaetales bacterium]|nr:hypothetical protein [Spirochaetales bacterium]
MEKYFLTGLILCLMLITSSCSNLRVYVDVMEGNYAFFRGEYQEANLAYLNVKGQDPYSEYISYNLGNVYYALGEIDSAFEEWGSINEKSKTEIAVRSLFNTGVLLFELSRYEEAYRTFRSILELDPYHIDAKINLEYCIQKMNFTTENRAGIGETDMEELEKTDDVSRVLEFVRRRETNIWKAATPSNSDSEKLKDW